MKRLYWLCLTLAVGSGCSGEVDVHYGTTLCDNLHPCLEGLTCDDGICVSVEAGDARGSSGAGDWMTGDMLLPADADFCRVDAQCGADGQCVRGQCMQDPCAGIDCGSLECSVRCRPSPSSCDGVGCADDLEYCLLGGCVPLCVVDPCETTGCYPGVPSCTGGVCSAGTFCQNGFCEASTVNLCGDNVCAAGGTCIVDCIDASPCSPSPCNSGWWCEDLGGGDYTCHEIACAGIICPPGQRCALGDCYDPCEGKACAAGGSSGCGADGVCCGVLPDRQCCPDHFLCQDGQCVPPDCVNPDCEPDETCLPDGCYCGPLDDLQACTDDECCLDGGCQDPCAGNECPPEARGCIPNCELPEGYECVDLCAGVSCAAEDNTQCNPADGKCYCDSAFAAACGGTRCCSDTEACGNPCDPNPCPLTAAPDSHECIRQCVPSGADFSCRDYCQPGDCAADALTVCDHETGDCVCGAGLESCGGGLCCGASGCFDPCAVSPCPDPTWQCVPDCSADSGPRRTCINNCEVDPCIGLDNPHCNPSNGTCYCDDTTFANRCAGSDCCDEGDGTCKNPCSPNPCLNNGDDTLQRCRRACVDTGADYTCTNRCASKNCPASDSNTVCDFDTGNCVCGPTEERCGNTECCSSSGSCVDPCATANCGALACQRDCTSAQGFICVDMCAVGACSGQDNSQCNPADGECYCDAAFTAQCSGGSNCCNGSACVDPCADPGNPCLVNTLEQRCTPLCSAATPYVCNDPCDPDPCDGNNMAPDCNHETGQCQCGSGAACGGGQLCCAEQCQEPIAEPPGCAVQSNCAYDPCIGCYKSAEGPDCP